MQPFCFFPHSFVEILHLNCSKLENVLIHFINGFIQCLKIDLYIILWSIFILHYSLLMVTITLLWFLILIYINFIKLFCNHVIFYLDYLWRIVAVNSEYIYKINQYFSYLQINVLIFKKYFFIPPPFFYWPLSLLRFTKILHF